MNPFTTELLSKISSIIVKRFVRSGSVEPDEYEDMVQTLRMRYLAKKDHIESLYKGDAQPQTYMSSVLSMMMLEELRAKNRQLQTEDIEAREIHIEKPDTALTPEQKAIINNEKSHLERVLMSMGKDKAKIIVCLKLIYRIKITAQDMERYLQGRQYSGQKDILDFTESEKNKDIYQRLCQFFNQVEKSDNKPDAVRIWLGTKTDQILKRMNSTGKSRYDQESLGILMEIAYAEE